MATATTTDINAGGSSMLKRAHSSKEDRPVPELPKLTGDIILDVFSHSSLPGSNEKLVVLGRAVAEAVITHFLFYKRPHLDSKEIGRCREKILSPNSVDGWTRAYNLRNKLRWDRRKVKSQLIDSAEEGQTLFYSYVGGIYIESGFDVVREWIAGLIPADNFDLPEEGPPKKTKRDVSPPDTQPSEYIPISPPAHRATPDDRARSPSPEPNPLSPAQPNLPFLPLFNQTAQQRRVSVEYMAKFSGPPHAGVWEVTCIVNGIEKGQGISGHKQRAKEEAARKAYYAMGWAPRG